MSCLGGLAGDGVEQRYRVRNAGKLFGESTTSGHHANHDPAFDEFGNESRKDVIARADTNQVVATRDELGVARFEKCFVGTVGTRAGEDLPPRAQNLLGGEHQARMAADEHLIFGSHVSGVGIERQRMFERVAVAVLMLGANEVLDIDDMQRPFPALPLFRQLLGVRRLAHGRDIDVSRAQLKHRPARARANYARVMATTSAEEFWDVASPLIAEGALEESTMMGGPCVRAAGEFVAMPHHKGDGIVVKLPRERVDDLIEQGVGAPFAPAKKVFKEWVLVEAFDEALWEALLRESVVFVG